MDMLFINEVCYYSDVNTWTFSLPLHKVAICTYVCKSESAWTSLEWKRAALSYSLESSGDLKDVLDLFAIEMDEVSKVVQGFFDKYCGGVVDEDFLREFEKFYTSISKKKNGWRKYSLWRI